jgi:hypothetical protein
MNTHISWQPVRRLLAVGCLSIGMLAIYLMLTPRPASAGPNEPMTISRQSGITSSLGITGVPTDRMLIEGDMLVPLDYYTRQQKNNAPDAFYRPNLWPGGTVLYRFDASVANVSQALMITAMQQWQAVANVQFQVCNPCSGAFVTIRNNPTSNFADIGRTGAEQFVNINAWNDRLVMVHELGHTLGLRHEQTRPDRDQYVIIYTQNITPGQAGNFTIATDAAPYGPYDFDSVMHYGSCFFSLNPTACANSGGVVSATIGLRPAYSGTVFGTQSHLTYMDKIIMAQLYPYANWRFVDVNYGGAGSGLTFFDPYQSFATGTANVPAGGTVVVQPGSYSGAATYTKAQTWIAPIGGVILH